MSNSTSSPLEPLLSPLIQQLVQPLTTELKTFIKELFEANKEEELQAKFLSPAETCKLFQPKISLVTLNAWEKAGHLTKYYIGGRTYYRYDEIMQAVKHLKRYKTGSKLQTNE